MVAVDSQTGTMLSLMRGELLEAERVHSIVGAFFTVYNYYGYGLGEAIYAGALEYELIAVWAEGQGPDVAPVPG